MKAVVMVVGDLDKRISDLGSGIVGPGDQNGSEVMQILRG